MLSLLLGDQFIGCEQALGTTKPTPRVRALKITCVTIGRFMTGSSSILCAAFIKGIFPDEVGLLR